MRYATTSFHISLQKAMVMRKLWLLSLLIAPLWASAAVTNEFTLANGLKVVVREDHRSPGGSSSVISGSISHWENKIIIPKRKQQVNIVTLLFIIV